MSAPIRFLGLAIIAYVGIRTASSALALEAVSPADTKASTKPAPAAEMLPPGVPAAMEPAQAYQGPAPYGAGPYGPVPYGAAYGPMPYGYMPAAAPMPQQMLAMPYPMMAAAYPASRASRIVYVPAPYPVAAPAYSAQQAALGSSYDAAASAGYGKPVAPLEEWPTIGSAGPTSLGSTAIQETPSWGKRQRGDDTPLASLRPDRWSVDAWALLRTREGVYRSGDADSLLNPGLASAGSLGGSQAGMRITWRPLTSIGVHLRASTALMPRGRSIRNQAMIGGEGALGISWQPSRAIPVRVLAERRQRLGDALGGGRNAFALMAEGGLYQKPLPFGLILDGYGQAGVVGANRRDLFADGALTATYPLMPRLAIGAGMWGGIQPELSRFDAGPRLSYQLRPGLRAHVDYRFKLTGNAQPGSGPALTLAAGF